MKRSAKLSIVIILYFFIGVSLRISAQSEKYCDYNAIITNYEYSYLLDMDDDSLRVSQTVNKRVRILNEKSKGLNKDYIFYSSFALVKDINAYTLVPKSRGFSKIKVDQFQKSSGTDRSVFYDDSKTIQFAYPSIQKGCVTSLNYTLDYKDPHFLRRCFLQSYLPVKNIKVAVKVHRDVELGYKLFNTEGLSVQFRQYSKGKYNYYEWVASDVAPYTYRSSQNFGMAYYSPHIAFFVKSVQNKDGKEDYFGSTNLLYHYYYDFVKGINGNISDDLKAEVLKITKGLDDDEKARAIYYWVHDNIKYIAFEDGFSGFIPTDANEVYKKRYGDCKGMSSLLQVMMEEAGLKTYIAWVGTRSIPYSYEEMPLPSVDNHMVAVRFQNDSLIVLDGTFKYLDYGVYPFHLQGKEVLVGMGPDKFKVCHIPFTSDDYSSVTDSAFIHISEQKVYGKAKVFYKGFNKMELAYTMDGVKLDKYINTYSRIFDKGNNKFKVIDQSSKNIFKSDTIAEVVYDFEIEDYYKQVGDEIYINLNVDKPYANLIVDTTGVISPVTNDFYYTEKYVTCLSVPSGYTVTYVPEDDSYSNNLFGYTIHYSVDGNQVSVEKKLTSRFFVLLKDNLDEWNEMIRSLNKNYRNTLVLTKNE